MRQSARRVIPLLLGLSICLSLCSCSTRAQGDNDHAFRDLAYGDAPRQQLDLFVAPGASLETPSPVVFYFHGGGFKRGDKAGVSKNLIATMHDAGISVAAVNYRFVTTDPLPAAMHDGARAVQFLRLHADEYSLDAERFAVTGSSAGGGISMWIACHNDLADADSGDPVLRQSSRVASAFLKDVQISYDPVFWQEHALDRVVNRAYVERLMGFLTHVKTEAAFQAAIAEASPMTHVSADDPALYAQFKAGMEITPQTTSSALLHHPVHGVVLSEMCEAVGVPLALVYPGSDAPDETGYEFLKRTLTLPAAAAAE